MSLIEEALTKKEKSEKIPEINFIEKKNSSKRFFLLILLVILIFIIGGAFYFYKSYAPIKKSKILTSFKSQKKYSKLNQQNKPKPQETKKVVINDNLTNKKIYTEKNFQKIQDNQTKTKSINKKSVHHVVVKKTYTKPQKKIKKKNNKKKLVEKLLLNAYKKLEQGKLNDAINIYTAVLKVNPNSYEALINRAIAYEQLNEYSKAEKDLRKALNLAKNKAAKSYIYNILGAIYMKQNLDKKAIKFFKLSNTSDAYVNIALIYWRKNNLPEVLKNLKKAIMLDSSNAYAYYYLGLFYKNLKEKNKANNAFKKSYYLAKEKGDLNLLKNLKKYLNILK